MSPNSRLAAVVALTGLLAACSDGSAPTARSQVRFNLATGAATGPAFLSDTVATATDTLVLDSVQLVLRDIKFQRVNEDACDNENEPGDDNGTDSVPHTIRMASLHDDGGSDDGDDGHADACESFNAGPYLLDVPLDTAVAKAFTIAVDTGTYEQVRFRIHKPEDDGDARDVAFLAAHPDFNKVSIRVVGSFNGQAFTFITDLSAQERMALVPPLVVADSMQNVDVTIKVDVSKWFSNGAGGLVDPNTGLKGEANENLVKDNIRNSFRAFRDDNRDGEDDDHEGHD
ncbi:MAG TPA: hypothetical protein VLD58_02550 [Gemmatimonadales bacterium]|nr:hypothetical protein [Gemmatimonadales bacterium]